MHKLFQHYSFRKIFQFLLVTGMKQSGFLFDIMGFLSVLLMLKYG